MVSVAKPASPARPQAALDLGALVKERLRQSEFATQVELARAVGFSDSVVSALLNAERQVPRETVLTIAKALDPSPDWLETVAALWLVAKKAWRGGGTAMAHSTLELSMPLRELLVAQQRAAHHLPYRLLIDNVPPLATLYVEQQSYEDAGWRSLGETDTSPRPVHEVLRVHRDLLLTADAGGGKSTVQHLFTSESANWWVNQKDRRTSAPPYGWVIPVRVRATAIASSALATAVAETVHSELHEYLDAQLDDALFRAAPGRGMKWLLLVDGLDEILDVGQRTRVISAIARRVEEAQHPYRFLIASRPLRDIELMPLRNAGAVHYKLQPFTPPQLAEFAGNWFRARPDGGDPMRFLQSIERARLAPVVTLPLLATIAAIVYEKTSDGTLPGSRAGLYREFFRYLLDVRQAYFQARRRLLDDLADYRGGRELSEWLFESITQILEHIAVEHILRIRASRPGGDALWQLAIDWTEANAPRPVTGIPQWNDCVRSLLIGTGVVRVVGGVLEFVHRSFAEYLTGGRMVTQWLTDGMTDNAVEQIIHQLDRESVKGSAVFALGRWLDDGKGSREPNRLLRELIHDDRLGRLELAADLVADGVYRDISVVDELSDRLYEHAAESSDSVPVIAALARLPDRTKVVRALLNLARADDPEFVNRDVEIARQLHALDRHDDAFAVLDRILERSGEDFESVLTVTVSLAELGARERAIEILKGLSERDDLGLDEWYVLANELYKAGEIGLACRYARWTLNRIEAEGHAESAPGIQDSVELAAKLLFLIARAGDKDAARQCITDLEVTWDDAYDLMVAIQADLRIHQWATLVVTQSDLADWIEMWQTISDQGWAEAVADKLAVVVADYPLMPAQFMRVAEILYSLNMAERADAMLLDIACCDVDLSAWPVDDWAKGRWEARGSALLMLARDDFHEVRTALAAVVADVGEEPRRRLGAAKTLVELGYREDAVDLLLAACGTGAQSDVCLLMDRHVIDPDDSVARYASARLLRLLSDSGKPDSG